MIQLNDILRKLLLVILGVGLIALGAQVSIGQPIPLTLQTLALMLVAAYWRWPLGPVVVLAYVFLGAVGLPIFAGGKGGFLVLLGPSGGFLAGFIIALTWMSWRIKRRPLSGFFDAFFLFVKGHGLILAAGFIGLFFIKESDTLFPIFLKLLPGLFIKSSLAALSQVVFFNSQLPTPNSQLQTSPLKR